MPWSRPNLERLAKVGALGRALGLVNAPEPAPVKREMVYVLAGNEIQFERWQADHPEVEAIRLVDEKQLFFLSDPAFTTTGTFGHDVETASHLLRCVSVRGHQWRSRR